MSDAEKFNQEPATLTRPKVGLLICGLIGFMAFLFLYFVSWLYPVVSSTFSRLVLFHLMHAMLFIATCMVRAATKMQLEWFVIYIAAYIMSSMLDLIGCIWRTVLFHGWSGPVVDTVVGWIMIIGSWVLLLIDIVQIILCAECSRQFKTFTTYQNLVVHELLKDNGLVEEGTLASMELEKLAKKMGRNIKFGSSDDERTTNLGARRRQRTEQPE